MDVTSEILTHSLCTKIGHDICSQLQDTIAVQINEAVNNTNSIWVHRCNLILAAIIFYAIIRDPYGAITRALNGLISKAVYVIRSLDKIPHLVGYCAIVISWIAVVVVTSSINSRQ